MKIFSLFLVAGFLLTTAAVDVTQGGFGAAKQEEKKSERKREGKTTNPTYPFYGTLDSVDAKAETITLRGKKKNRVILFTSETRITKDGTRASVADGTPGERVSGSVRKNSEGKEEAVTIRFGAKAAGK